MFSVLDIYIDIDKHSCNADYKTYEKAPSLNDLRNGHYIGSTVIHQLRSEVIEYYRTDNTHYYGYFPHDCNGRIVKHCENMFCIFYEENNVVGVSVDNDLNIVAIHLGPQVKLFKFYYYNSFRFEVKGNYEKEYLYPESNFFYDIDDKVIYMSDLDKNEYNTTITTTIYRVDNRLIK